MYNFDYCVDYLSKLNNSQMRYTLPHNYNRDKKIIDFLFNYYNIEFDINHIRLICKCARNKLTSVFCVCGDLLSVNSIRTCGKKQCAYGQRDKLINEKLNFNKEFNIKSKIECIEFFNKLSISNFRHIHIQSEYEDYLLSLHKIYQVDNTVDTKFLILCIKNNIDNIYCHCGNLVSHDNFKVNKSCSKKCGKNIKLKYDNKNYNLKSIEECKLFFTNNNKHYKISQTQIDEDYDYVMSLYNIFNVSTDVDIRLLIQLLLQNETELFCKICKVNYRRMSTIGGRPFLSCDNQLCIDKVISLPISHNELNILNYIKDHNIDIVNSNRTILNGKELDIYIPSHNLAIEFNGTYWHSEYKGKDKNYHINKTNLCKEKGIQLIHIWEYLYKNENTKIIYHSIISNKLKLNTNKIYARKCEVRIINNKISNEFCDKNHLQGSVNSLINLGLYYNDELFSVMTLGKPRFNKDYDYELIRFCNKLFTNVVGGASKLLKYFEVNFKPKSLLSYASNDYSDGNLYSKLGFKYNHHSDPNYVYAKANGEIISRYQSQKHKLEKLLINFDSNLSETENMKLNGYNKIWNTGNMVFIKHYKI